MKEITGIVLEVELVKQIPPLTEQQRIMLVRELSYLDLTREELIIRANSVKVKNTYGNIAKEHWVQDLVMLLPDAERLAQSLAHKIIERRRKEFQTIKCPNEHEVAAAGLIDMQTYGRMVWERLKAETGRDLDTRCKKAEAFLRLADENTRNDLYQKLIYKTKEDYDPIMVKYLYVRSAELLDEVEVM